MVLGGWSEGGISPIVLPLNFSPLHLRNHSFVDALRDIAERYGVPCRLLELKFSESAMRNNLNHLEDRASRLNSAGFSLSLDGFGSGDSSLRLLRGGCVDIIKIVPSFFSEDWYAEQADTVINPVAEMAHGLGIRIVAEGVELKSSCPNSPSPARGGAGLLLCQTHGSARAGNSADEGSRFRLLRQAI